MVEGLPQAAERKKMFGNFPLQIFLWHVRRHPAAEEAPLQVKFQLSSAAADWLDSAEPVGRLTGPGLKETAGSPDWRFMKKWFQSKGFQEKRQLHKKKLIKYKYFECCCNLVLHLKCLNKLKSRKAGGSCMTKKIWISQSRPGETKFYKNSNIKKTRSNKRLSAKQPKNACRKVIRGNQEQVR